MEIDQILAVARKRAQEMGLPYGGALTPREAYEVWRGKPGASGASTEPSNTASASVMIST